MIQTQVLGQDCGVRAGPFKASCHYRDLPMNNTNHPQLSRLHKRLLFVIFCDVSPPLNTLIIIISNIQNEIMHDVRFHSQCLGSSDV